MDRIKRETIPADESLRDMLAVQAIFNAALDGVDHKLAGDVAGMDSATAIADRLTLATNAVRELVADNIVTYARTLDR